MTPLTKNAPHILKTQGFWDAGSSGVARAAAHWRGGAYTKNARVLGTNARSSRILKTQGFWGRTRVRRIYLKRKGFWGRTRVRNIYLKRKGVGDERAFVAYT